jgi:hypothetical protein
MNRKVTGDAMHRKVTAGLGPGSVSLVRVANLDTSKHVSLITYTFQGSLTNTLHLKAPANPINASTSQSYR